MCPPIGYKSLPYVLAVITLLDLGLGILRIYIFFSPKSAVDPSGFSDILRSTVKDQVPSPLISSHQARGALALDWISSIVPTFMGVYIFLFSILTLISCFAACQCLTKPAKKQNPACETCGPCFLVMCCLCMSKPNHRFISFSCNCPCYKARPRLRFTVRLGLIAFFIACRVIAVVLYATDQNVRIYGRHMAFVCGISLALLLLVIILDYVQYRMWWNYRPEGAYEPCDFTGRHFDPRHHRFLPSPLLGKYREMNSLLNRPCPFLESGKCPDRSLEHMAIFHGPSFRPLPRYRAGIDQNYIGFHQTKDEYCVSIAKTGFRISSQPPQMLGFGIYFARSFEDTNGKARQKGSFIVAEINMGRVKIVTVDQLKDVQDTDAWWKDFDTVYYAHQFENRDELCIKDQRQILKWIMVMDDQRLYQYGLDQEFANTQCGCI